MDVSSGERATKCWDIIFCLSPAFSRQHSLPSVRSPKAKLCCVVNFFFFFLNMACDRIFPYLAPRAFSSTSQTLKLRRTDHSPLSRRTLLSATLIYIFWWKKEKKVAFAMFSGFLVVLSVIHSALQPAGKCLPLVSCKTAWKCFRVSWHFRVLYSPETVPVCTLLVWDI